MNNNQNPDNKILVVIASLIITVAAVYFSIPKLMDVGKYQKLSSRLDGFNWGVQNPSYPQWQGQTGTNKQPSGNQSGNNDGNNQTTNPDINSGDNNGSSTNPQENQNQSNPPSTTTPSQSNPGGETQSPSQNNPSTTPQTPSTEPIPTPADPSEEPDLPEENNPEPPKIEDNPVIDTGGEKTFTVAFYQNGATSISANKLECTTKTDSCTITLPNITRTNGTVYGWSSQNGKSAEYAPNSTFTVTKNQYLYAITSRSHKATFDSNGATLNFSEITCTAYNTSRCTISIPTITRKNGYGLGFSTNKDATKGEYTTSLRLTADVILYAISASDYTATFHKNGALYIGSNTLSCTAYNRNASCNVTAPTIEKDSYTILGWNKSSEASDIAFQVGSEITLSSNQDFYAIRKINDAGFLTNEAYQGLALVNKFRRENGVSELKWSKSLEFSAQLRAYELVNFGYSTEKPHYRPNGTIFYTANDLAEAENWTETNTTTAQEMFDHFYTSTKGHREEMLNSANHTIGIAALKSPNGFVYWVQLFGE